MAALTVIPTARFSGAPWSAIDGGRPDAASTRGLVAAAGLDPRWRSRMIQASAVCSRSNSLTWISPWRAVDFQWIRLKLSPGAYGRTVVASGVVWSVRSGDAWLPSMLRGRQPPARQRARPAGRRPRETPWPTVADASKKPNGSPVRIWSGSIRKWPRRASGARTSHDRSLRDPSVMARPGRPPGSVVGLWTSSQGLGSRLALRSV